MMAPVSERPFPPTRTQLYVLHAIDDLTRANGQPPTCQEIADELDYPHKSRVWAICQLLYDRGWLEPCTPGSMRSLVLTRDPPPLPEHPFEVTAEGSLYLAHSEQPAEGPAT